MPNTDSHKRASAKYQMQMRKNGLCPKCGDPADGYYCPRHKKIDREQKKARRAVLRKQRNGKKSAPRAKKSLSRNGDQV